MHLVYLDESGNTGLNLNDAQQPIFVLCAMIVDEAKWQSLEDRLMSVVNKYFPPPRADDFEIHGSQLRTGQGPFKGMSVADRIAFRDLWMDAAAEHNARLIYRAIDKKRLLRWLQSTFGPGVFINPHVAAFALIARVIDDYLRALPRSPLGIFVSDENREIISDVEKSIRILRGTSGPLRLSQIVEKGFFIQSTKSLPLQLCDVFALSLRKMEEAKAGLSAKSIDESGIKRAEALIHRGNEANRDVLAWLTEQRAERKKEATRD